MGFVQSASDPCIYMDAGGVVFYIGIYVDDIILAGKSDKKIKEVNEALERKFDIKDMGKLHYFLRMKVLKSENNGNVWIGQPAYMEKLLNKFGMQDAKPVSTPVDTSVKIIKAIDNDEYVDQQLYQSAIGSLLYLSVGTKPDITYTVSNLARFSAMPTKQHWISDIHHIPYC